MVRHIFFQCYYVSSHLTYPLLFQLFVCSNNKRKSFHNAYELGESNVLDAKAEDSGSRLPQWERLTPNIGNPHSTAGVHLAVWATPGASLGSAYCKWILILQTNIHRPCYYNILILRSKGKMFSFFVNKEFCLVWDAQRCTYTDSWTISTIMRYFILWVTNNFVILCMTYTTLWHEV